MKYCNYCGRIVDERCELCKYANEAKDIIPKEDIMPEDHEDDWYIETHEDADFWDNFEGGFFYDDEKEGDES